MGDVVYKRQQEKSCVEAAKVSEWVGRPEVSVSARCLYLESACTMTSLPSPTDWWTAEDSLRAYYGRATCATHEATAARSGDCVRPKFATPAMTRRASLRGVCTASARPAATASAC